MIEIESKVLSICENHGAKGTILGIEEAKGFSTTKCFARLTIFTSFSDQIGIKCWFNEHPHTGYTMQTKVKCDCGVTIDIAGATPRGDGIKVWCRVCGTTTVHHKK